MHKLASRKVTGNSAKNMLEALANNLSQEDQVVLERIINKNLGAGVSISTINKVWPGKIPVFNVMLCHPLNERSIKEIKFPCFVQIKYDAARVTVIVKNGSVRYFTRNGKEYLINNPDLNKDFIAMAELHSPHKSLIFDGELYKKGADRVQSNSVATKFVRGTADIEDHFNVSIVLWDIITIDEFATGKGKSPYSSRLMGLAGLITKIDKPGNNISIAHTEVLTSLDEIREYNDKVISSGEEGVIIKNYNGTWEAKRSYHSIKMKEELESELRVVNVVEGKGKYVGLCGALQCESEDGLVTVSVGTGLNDEFRNTYAPGTSSDIINKIITVRHNGIIKDNKGNHSLYLPRFIEIRFDKDIADDITKIKNEGK